MRITVKPRERERDRERHRETERQRQTDRDRDRETETQKTGVMHIMQNTQTTTRNNKQKTATKPQHKAKSYRTTAKPQGSRSRRLKDVGKQARTRFGN